MAYHKATGILYNSVCVLLNDAHYVNFDVPQAHPFRVQLTVILSAKLDLPLAFLSASLLAHFSLTPLLLFPLCVAQCATQYVLCCPYSRTSLCVF